MKAYIFFEWPYAGMGPEVEAKPCHEIEVLDGADKIYFETTDSAGYIFRGFVPIPRPKMKIKKWKWVVPIHDIPTITESYFTEEEMKASFKREPFLFWYHRIDETEIEVDA
jgi:hypothetical protein